MDIFSIAPYVADTSEHIALLLSDRIGSLDKRTTSEIVVVSTDGVLLQGPCSVDMASYSQFSTSRNGLLAYESKSYPKKITLLDLEVIEPLWDISTNAYGSSRDRVIIFPSGCVHSAPAIGGPKAGRLVADLSEFSKVA